MLGSDTFPWGSGSTDDIMVYVNFSGKVAAPESSMWWGRGPFITRLDARVPRLHTVVRGTQGTDSPGPLCVLSGPSARRGLVLPRAWAITNGT
jgi:hypothetical protein